MVPVRVFRAEYRRGQVHLDSKRAYDEYCAALFREGEELEVIVRPKRRKPRPEMHGYYRGHLLPAIAEAYGLPMGPTHRMLKREFFARGGTSLGRISRRLFVEFIQFCHWVLAFLGVPDPREFEFEV